MITSSKISEVWEKNQILTYRLFSEFLFRISHRWKTYFTIAFCSILLFHWHWRCFKIKNIYFETQYQFRAKSLVYLLGPLCEESPNDRKCTWHKTILYTTSSYMSLLHLIFEKGFFQRLFVVWIVGLNGFDQKI